MAGPSFTKFGALRNDLEAAPQDRLEEANELLAQGRYGSAIAHGLYALEIYLKARICLTLDLEALPTAFQIHELDGLLILSGLQRRMENLGSHPVKVNWDVLASKPIGTQHVADLRYKPNRNWTQEQAEELINRIQDPADGVLTWLRAQS